MQLAVGLLAGIILVGCQVEQQSSSYSSAAPTESALTEVKQNEAQIIYGENGLPPLEDEVLERYRKAYEFYRKYYMCGFQVDYNKPKNVNDAIYYPVNEAAFKTLEELKDYIKAYFTGSALNEMLLDIDDYFIEEDGVLYALNFAGADNLFYSGHVFQLVSESSTKIELKLIRYLAKSPEYIPEETFYTIPTDLEDYDIEEMPFVLEKEGADWKISEMHLINK